MRRDNDILLKSGDYDFFLKALAAKKTKPSKRARSAAKRNRAGRRKGATYHIEIK